MKSNITLACVIAVTACAQHAAAQEYPDRPVRIVCPFPPGGSTDFAARILSTHLPKSLRQTFVVDNRGGAGGNIGTEIAAKAAPDGYTLLVSPEGPLTISPSLYPRLPYVPSRDFTAITQVIKYANVVVVNPTVKVSTMKDLIQRAKEQPRKFSYAHPGVGTNVHLASELLKLMAGVDIVSVSYKGGGPAILSVISNETQMSFATAPSSIPHVKSGKLRAVAVTTAKRSSVLPDLPTIAESGVPGYNVEGWVGLLAPTKTPPRIISRLYDETLKVLALQEVKDFVATGGSEIGGTPSQETQKIIREEGAMWDKLIKTLGVKVE